MNALLGTLLAVAVGLIVYAAVLEVRDGPARPCLYDHPAAGGCFR